MELEPRDLEILQILRENGRLSNRKIAEMTSIPITTVLNRIKLMEKEGIILQYVTRLDFSQLGYNTVAYVFVTLDNNKLRELNMMHESITEKIAQEFPFVTHITAVSGREDIIIRLRAENNNELNKHVNKIRAIEGVLRTETMIALHDVNRKKIMTNFVKKKWKRQN
ncbi:Lrp/AsnC family transcriptional regulator [Candidatus Woesearchaeota archaeon]|nr:Lrp/AsnC family transcriptional regulator [Candidatus Woesearchaeota archaeon]